MAKIEYCANAEKPVKTLFKRIKKRIKWQINATYTRPKRPFKKTINKLESYMTKEYRQTDKKRGLIVLYRIKCMQNQHF